MAHPQRFDDDDPLLARVRDMALAFPGAAEKISHGRPNFYTRKIFASYGATLKGDHYSTELDHSLVFLPDEDEREALLQDERIVVPGYVGAYGWLALDLTVGAPDWVEIRELMESSYRLTATKTLISQLDSSQDRSS